MSSTNGFHPPSTSMACNGQSAEISKRLPSTSSTCSTSSNSTITTTNKRLKVKLTLPTVNETRIIRTTKKKKKKGKTVVEATRKRLQTSDSNNNNNNHHHPNSHKKLKQPTTSHARHLLSHPILHHPKKSHTSSENIPSSSTTNKSNHHFHRHHHHHHHHHHHGNHVINNDHCDSCGEFYGEMISCDTCPATFHLLCANPPLSREDVPKGSYFCENCRAKAAEDDKQLKINIQPIKSVPSEPKLCVQQTNGFKKQTQRQSALEQLASNGRSLVQPSGEIKFRATNNTTKSKTSGSNLKRKRMDSSISPPSTMTNKCQPVKNANTQIESLRRLLLSCRPEEFRGPTLPFDDPSYNRESHVQKNSSTWQTFCFICRKSSANHGPSIHCDYCPLTYHFDCLTPPMTSSPSSADKWMCPNHIEPILDRYLFDRNRFSTSERVKIYQKYSHIEHQTILQEFARMRETKKHFLTKPNQRLERIEISQIPKVIEQFYLNTRRRSIDRQEEQKDVQIINSPEESSSAFDPTVWDVLKAIVNEISDGDLYEFSSVVDFHPSIDVRLNTTKSIDTLDRIETLLEALNEPNYSHEIRQHNSNGLAALIAAADSCFNDQTSTSLAPSISTSPFDSFALLIDLTQFRQSHAALIHLRSKHVIYIRKHAVWFGCSLSNDICLRKFNEQQTCQYVTDRHACLYYDRKRNLFELLNYSEYGTIVNGLRYGLGNISDDDEDEENSLQQNTSVENEKLQKCFCLSSPSYHSAWDGPAQIEQGTVVQIGCHQFLFYRHVVR